MRTSRRVSGVLVLLGALAFALYGVGVNAVQQITCHEEGGGGGEEPDTPPDTAKTPLHNLPDSLGPVVETRIIFITSDDVDSVHMASADWLVADLENFFTHVSNGKQRHNVEIIKRLDDSTLAWRAPDGDPKDNYDATHRTMIQDIYDA